MWRCKTFMQITPLILTPTGRLSLMMAHEIYTNLLMYVRFRQHDNNLPLPVGIQPVTWIMAYFLRLDFLGSVKHHAGHHVVH